MSTKDKKESPALSSIKRASATKHHRSASSDGAQSRRAPSPSVPELRIRDSAPSGSASASAVDLRHRSSELVVENGTKRNSGGTSGTSRTATERQWGIEYGSYEPLFRQQSRRLRAAKAAKHAKSNVPGESPDQPTAGSLASDKSDSEEDRSADSAEDCGEDDSSSAPSSSPRPRRRSSGASRSHTDFFASPTASTVDDLALHTALGSSAVHRFRLDDLKIVRQSRGITANQAVPADCEGVCPSVREGITLLTDDHVILSRTYAKYGNLEKATAPATSVDSATGATLNSNDDCESRERSESEDMSGVRPTCLERDLVDPSQRTATRSTLDPFRQPVFGGSHAPPPQERNTRVIARAVPFAEREPDLSVSLMDYVLEVPKELDGAEPFFLRFALYSIGDDGETLKLCPDFSVIPAESQRLLFSGKGDVSVQLPAAILSLIRDRSFMNVYLIVVVERLFEGGLEAAKNYALATAGTLPRKVADQLRERVKAQLDAAPWGSGADYSTIPCFWGATKIVDATGHLVEELLVDNGSRKVANPIFAGSSAKKAAGEKAADDADLGSSIVLDLFLITAKTCTTLAICDMLRAGKDALRKLKIASRLRIGLKVGRPANSEATVSEVLPNFQTTDPAPYLSFSHRMYINPVQVPLKVSSGDVVIMQVELRVDDGPSDDSSDTNQSQSESRQGTRVFHERFVNASAVAGKATHQSVGDDGSRLVSTITSSVAISKNSGVHFFNGEIAIDLPLNLSTKHHLVFTFFAIQTKKGGRTRQQLGHAVLPLFAESILTKDKTYHLALFSQKDKTIDRGGYFDEALNAFHRAAKEVQNADKCFVISTRCLSTIYAMDVSLSKFLRGVSSKKDKSVLKALTNLGSADVADCFRYLPVVLNLLLALLVRSTCGELGNDLNKKKSGKALSAQFASVASTASHDVPRATFLALIQLLNRLDEPRSAHMLQSYVSFLFGARSCHSSVHAPIVVLWNRFASHSAMAGFKSQWFFCQIIVKSIALAAEQFGILNQSARYALVPRRELQLIRAVVCSTVKQTHLLLSSLETMVALPLLVCSLFSLGDRGEVFGIFLEAISEIPSVDVTTAMIKFKFWLRIIGDHEQVVALGLPSLLDLGESDVEYILAHVERLRKAQEQRIEAAAENGADILAGTPTAVDGSTTDSIRDGQKDLDGALSSLVRNIFARRHLLPVILVREVTACLDFNTSPRVREQAISMLRNHFYKLEFDDRFSPRILREIGGVYFPFCVDVVSAFGAMQAIDSVQELHKWLLCHLWVLKNTKSKILSTWLDAADLSHISVFLATLMLCLEHLLDHGKRAEANFIVLEVTMTFIKLFEPRLNGPQPHVLSEKIFHILQKLQTSKDVAFLTCLYACLATAIPRLHSALFIHKQTGTLCQNLITGLVGHCNGDDEVLRQSAAGLFYIMLEENFRLCSNTGRMDIQSTVAITKYVGAEKGRRCVALTSELRALVARAQQLNTTSSTFGELQAQFDLDVQKIVKHMIDITGYEQEINRNWVDGETVADLYIRIAQDFQKNPDMRCTWLENLAVVNMQNGNIEEAAQCKLHIAYLVAEYLLQSTKKRTIHPLPLELRTKNVLETFTTICPNAGSEPPLLSDSAGANAETSFQGTQWTVDGLVTVLVEAEKLLQRANRFELSLSVLHILSRIFTHTRNYPAMLEWTDKYQAVVKRLSEQQQSGQEVFSRYYRLQLFGPESFLPKGEQRLHILKKSAKHTIGNITTQLKQQLVHKLKLQEEQVVSVPNSVTGDELTKLDAQQEKLYFQIVSVVPFFEESEREERQTFAEQQFNLKIFTSVVPYMVGGGKVDDAAVERLAKRKTYYTTHRAFPYMNNRLPVVHVRDETLNALDCALEAMRDRVQQFRAQIRETPLRPNALQALLTGTLAAAVNVGPLRYCEVFIAEDSPWASSYPQSQRMELRSAMAELIFVSGIALRLNEGLIDKKQIPLQQMLATKYAQLRADFQEKFADAGSLKASNFDPIDSPHV